MSLLQEMMLNPVAAAESALPAVNIRKNDETFEVVVSGSGLRRGSIGDDLGG